MKIITVELDSPIMYAGGNGSEVEGSFLEILEPTGKVANLVAILKVEGGSATRKAFEGIGSESAGSESDSSASQDSNPEEDGATLFSIMTMGDADMPRVMTTFKELLKLTSKIGGEKSFTAPMFDRMVYSDVEKALKSYLGNFIAA